MTLMLRNSIAAEMPLSLLAGAAPCPSQHLALGGGRATEIQPSPRRRAHLAHYSASRRESDWIRHSPLAEGEAWVGANRRPRPRTTGARLAACMVNATAAALGDGYANWISR